MFVCCAGDRERHGPAGGALRRAERPRPGAGAAAEQRRRHGGDHQRAPAALPGALGQPRAAHGAAEQGGAYSVTRATSDICSSGVFMQYDLYMYHMYVRTCV